MLSIKRILSFAVATALAIQCVGLIKGGEPEGLPRLAQLKLAAEAGDPVAQYEYSYALVGRPDEQFAWRLRSAEQGYPPAQDAVGAYYTGPFALPRGHEKEKDREAVRWTSRAAFSGNPAAQIRLSKFYSRGTGVEKDPVTAYMWTQLAIQNPNSGAGERISAGLQRDQLITSISSEDIAEGQRRAASFVYPPRGEMNPIERGLLVAQMKLSGIFHAQDQIFAAVNGVRFKVGSKNEIKVDAHGVVLECLSIGPKAAKFKVGGFDTIVQLSLK